MAQGAAASEEPLYEPQVKGSASAGGEDAELVALRVGQNRPWDVALAHIGGRRTEILQARDQLRLMGRGGGGEIEVQAKPAGSALVRPGPSLETPQPSASAQNRPSAESSRALKFT